MVFLIAMGNYIFEYNIINYNVGYIRSEDFSKNTTHYYDEDWL